MYNCVADRVAPENLYTSRLPQIPHLVSDYMVIVMLTQSKLKELMTYNPETGLFTRIKSYHSNKVGTCPDKINSKGYCEISIGSKKYKSHRLAWLYMTGDLPENQIDHINGIKSDNRWVNLRQATNAENCRNKKKKGFCVTRSGSYQAEIQTGDQRIYLGTFKTREEAKEAYAKVMHKYHGEFARQEEDKH